MKVLNISSNPRQYIVAREWDEQLWYWGSWDNRDAAKEAALEVGGIVVDRDLLE